MVIIQSIDYLILTKSYVSLWYNLDIESVVDLINNLDARRWHCHLIENMKEIGECLNTRLKRYFQIQQALNTIDRKNQFNSVLNPLIDAIFNVNIMAVLVQTFANFLRVFRFRIQAWSYKFKKVDMH